MSIENVVAFYKKIYKLPELTYEEYVSDDFFKFYKKVHHFVIVSVYNSKKEILLIRDFNKNIGWEIPGGCIHPNESIESAVHRITLRETGLEIDEIEPIAVVKIFLFVVKKPYLMLELLLLL